MMLGLKFCLFFAYCVVFIDGKSVGDHAESAENFEIIGGTDVDIRQYPHQIALLQYNVPICGGSIISEQFVLTAAHCIENDRNPSSYKVRAGSTYKLHGGTLYEIVSMNSHPNYGGAAASFDYDAAILRTSEKIAINGETMKIVQLAPSGSVLRPGQQVTVSGWGDTTGTGQYSPTLKAVSVPIVDPSRCRNVWPQLTARMICAGYDQPGKNSCNGDSGGPLITEGDVIQYGIVSFGRGGCNVPYYPNVYTNVPAIRDWIKEVSGV